MQEQPSLLLPVVSGGDDGGEDALVFDGAPFRLAFEVGAFLGEPGDVFLALDQLFRQALNERVLGILQVVGRGGLGRRHFLADDGLVVLVGLVLGGSGGRGNDGRGERVLFHDDDAKLGRLCVGEK